MIDLLKKGNFQYINNCFIKESIVAMKALSEVQNKFKKGDMDSLLNELHDSIVGQYLGFKLINIEKHGFDCKFDVDKDIFLESKVASYSSSSWSATFNDTTLEKANLFRSNKVWLALSIWTSASDLLCICYGQNPEIGNILEKGVNKHKDGKTVRSTQSIGMSKLVFDLGFKILSVKYSAEDLIYFLNMHGLKKLTKSHIIEFKDFVSIFD